MAKGMHRAPSKGRSKYLIMLLVLGMFVALAVPAVAAPLPKVDVCHYADGTFHLINISENAFQAHVDHGDASPGDVVPGMDSNYVFDHNCNVFNEHIATGRIDATNYSGMVLAFDLWQDIDGFYLGEASYHYQTTDWSMDIAGACVNESGKTVTVWGTNTGNGFGLLTFFDDAGTMRARAGNFTTQAALDGFIAEQCPTPLWTPAYGSGYLTFW